MAAPSVTYEFQNDTTADANQVNQNFSDIINGITDGTKDLSISALTCAGAVAFNGTVTLGNATADDVVFNGYVASTILPKTASTYSLGDSTHQWSELHLDAGATHGGKLYFEAGTTQQIYSSDAGVNLNFSGWTTAKFASVNVQIPDGLVGTPSLAFGADTDTGLWRPTDNELAWSVAGALGMRLSSTGLGIGVAPSYGLHLSKDVAGEMVSYIYNANATGNGVTIQCQNDEADNYALRVQNGSGNTLLVSNDGQVSVETGNWGTGGTAIGVSAGVITTSPSSLRYKEQIVPLSYEIDSSRIYDLEPVAFKYKRDGRKSFGYLAEHVYEILPCLVHLEDGVPDSVSYAHLSVLNTIELGKLEKRVAALEGGN